MAHGIDAGGESDQRANELYWSSDASVNQIAHQLGLSKGGLYAAIQPRPSESLCPDCGRALVYENRTARDKGQLRCPRCARDFRELEGPSQTALPAGIDARSGAAVPPPVDLAAVAAPANAKPVLAAPRSPTSPPSPEADRPSGQLVVGTACLALGLGLLIRRWARE